MAQPQAERPAEPSMDEKKLRLKVRQGADPVEAKFELARFLLNSNRNPAEAERLLNDVFKNDPYKAGVAFCLGVAKCHQGELDEAVRHFRLCMQLDPNHGESFTCLTCISWKKDSGINVKYHLSKAPESAKSSHRYHILMGEFLIGYRNYRDAFEHLEEASSLAPESAKVHSLLAQCLWALGKRQDAQAHFQKAFSIEPNNLSIRTSFAMHSSPTGDIKLGGIGVPSPEDVETTDRFLRIAYNRNSVAALELRKGDVLQADIEAVEGGAVNVLLLTEGEFRKYSRKVSYRYYPDGTSLNTRHLQFSIKVPETGAHCLVIENSGFTPGGAEPDILNCGGTAIVRVQVVVGIPGTVRKHLGDSLFFGQMPGGQVPGLFERLVPGAGRKRKISFHMI
jgi:tetratricopeptide (TPR) repeat protein